MSGFQIATKLSQVELPGAGWQQVSKPRDASVDGLGFRRFESYSERGSIGKMSEGLLVARAVGVVLALIFSLGFAAFSYEIQRSLTNLDAHSYKVIAEYERDLSGAEHFARGLLGTLALVCSLGLAWLSFDVRNLFDEKATKMIAIRDHLGNGYDDERGGAWIERQITNFFTWYPNKTVDEFRAFCNSFDYKISYSDPKLFTCLAESGNLELIKHALEAAKTNSTEQLEDSYEECITIAKMIKSRLNAIAQWRQHSNDLDAYIADTVTMLKEFIPGKLDLRSPLVAPLFTHDAKYEPRSAAAHLLFTMFENIVYIDNRGWWNRGFKPVEGARDNVEKILKTYQPLIDFFVDQGLHESEIIPTQVKINNSNAEHGELKFLEFMVKAASERKKMQLLYRASLFDRGSSLAGLPLDIVNVIGGTYVTVLGQELDK